jgi:hypothetical protein
MARRRFSTWTEVDALDPAELVEGYWDGYNGEQEPSTAGNLSALLDCGGTGKIRCNGDRENCQTTGP